MWNSQFYLSIIQRKDFRSILIACLQHSLGMCNVTCTFNNKHGMVFRVVFCKFYCVSTKHLTTVYSVPLMIVNLVAHVQSVSFAQYDTGIFQNVKQCTSSFCIACKRNQIALFSFVFCHMIRSGKYLGYLYLQGKWLCLKGAATGCKDGVPQPIAQCTRDFSPLRASYR